MDTTNTGHEAGHKFLARLGKKRLRPGGRIATEWLLSHSGLQPDSQVLEIACNMGTTAIEIAQRFQCHITGIDMDKQALTKARTNILSHGLSNLITVQEADASKLPFPDNHFDVVINEAMLTMYADKAKARLLQEYFRVLKPGGRLLTHDIALTEPREDNDVSQKMQAAIQVKAQPMPTEAWVTLFRTAGFHDVSHSEGMMTLMTPRGMLHDEGLIGTLKIIRNALKAENRPQFLRMFRHFRQNRNRLRYIAVVSTK
ncbi:class I SAM-dependent methyltransferase [Klebsiella sp. BIGb0407]|uniref:class I SAM-dependent methyltransferase n=1 Tax=Klebsiella sp. BIGb0407 TaxID=2940603 RepID=UPI00216A3D3E|nr:class I SAM-dependent methyltransferase [Klebsiella sp. BIGb0407]MCS3432918.1 ubiquinone/menaquinone biosynthesis C-methylase UbiE [Klebsiella sp. BIGb0407]